MKENRKGLLHHSDRGIQYCCKAYVGALARKKVLNSLADTGDCYQNALAERINGMLKDD